MFHKMKLNPISDPKFTGREGRPDLSQRLVIYRGGVALVPHAVSQAAPLVVAALLDRPTTHLYHSDNGR